MHPLARLSLTVLCTAILLTTGCSPQAGPAETTPPGRPGTAPTTPPVIATAPPPVADAIELHAEELRVLAGTELIATLPLNDTPTSVAELSRLLGQPSTETVTPESTGNYCIIPSTRYQWGDELLLIDSEPDHDILSDYAVRISGSSIMSSSTRQPMSLRAATAVTIGDDLSAQIQAVPGMSESYEWQGVTHSTVILEQGFFDRDFGDGSIQGVAAFSENGIAKVLGAPVSIHSSTDC